LASPDHRPYSLVAVQQTPRFLKRDAMRNEEGTVHVRPPINWRFVASGLWIRLAFAGAALGGLGVVMLVSGDRTVLASLAAVVTGTALAAVGYRQAHASLDAIDGEAVAAPDSAPIRSPQTRLDLGFHPRA